MGNTYLILKSVHIFGVIVLLGNLIVTAWWKLMANRTKNPSIIAFAQRQVTITDFVFTAPGAFLAILAGDYMAYSSRHSHTASVFHSRPINVPYA